MSIVGPSASSAATSQKGDASKFKDPAVRGALWKVTSCLCFSAINGIVHYFSILEGSEKIWAPELAFFETLFGLILILPWVISKGTNPFITTQYPRYIMRAIAASLGITLWFTALGEMPIVQVVAFKYMGPFFTLMGAKFFLGERIGSARAMAIAVAVTGAMTITIMGHDLLEKGLQWQEIGLMALFPLGATACYATSAVFGKKLAKVDEPQVICFHLLLFTLPLLGLFSLQNWVTPELWQIPWLIAMGACLAFAYFALGFAYVAVDITYLMPLSFTRLIAGAVIGMIFFEEWPNMYTWIGSTLIMIASVTLCTHEVKEHQRKRNRAAALEAAN
jgi:drug/metabolite transporter (DMT)-like permease